MKPKEVNLLMLKSDFKKLKIFLIFLTIIEVGYFLLFITESQFSFTLDNTYKANYLVFALHVLGLGIFIWYNWKKMPIAKKKKYDNTYLILILGIIGMWLWLPNEKQINNC
jgi:amino acid transporter